jgi:hypothetical protein
MLLKAIFTAAKVAGAAQDYSDELRYENDRATALAEMTLDASGLPERHAELLAACTNPHAFGTLLFPDGDWAAREIDGVRPSGATPASVGFAYVCPGRHVVVTRAANRPASVLHFLVYPGETFVRRLEPSSNTFVRYDPSVEADWRAAAHGGQQGRLGGALLDYFATVARFRVTAGAARPVAQAHADAYQRMESVIARVIAGAAPAELAAEVNAIAIGLVGVPLFRDTLAKLTSVLGYHAWEQLSKGDLAMANVVCHLGLTILPDDPTLSSLLASVHAAGGDHARALQLLEAALDRRHAFAEGAEARAVAARDDARAKLGG